MNPHQPSTSQPSSSQPSDQPTSTPAPSAEPATDPAADQEGSRSILSASAVMASGTVVSRLSGLLRNTMLAAAIGQKLHGDVFNIANTIPNMLYILLAGGVVNAVLVPQLVRAMKSDPDRGAAYTNRIITLAGLFLAVVTTVLVIAAPLLMHLFLSGNYYTPEHAAQRESAILFARYCLPQVFFYGMFVLVGQVLNAHGRFGPMMWAPIANNVVVVVVLALYLGVFGSPGHAAQLGGYSPGQAALLGLGSTLGIVVQLLVLVPYLRAAGVRFIPRFDFLHTGLGHTLRLGMWTVLFVIVNQVAYTVVVNLASAGTAEGGQSGTGYSIYTNAFLLVMVPHAIVTVSLATAMLPRLSAHAADADLGGVATNVASTLRTAYVVIIPFALLLPVVAFDLSNFVYGWGASRSSVPALAIAFALFAPGVVFFSTHYLMLRGFYSLERTRTVFWVQCVIAAVNVVLAVALTRVVPPHDTAPALVIAYGGSYLVGAVGSYTLLRHVLGGLQTPTLVRFLGRLLPAAGIATAVAWAARLGLQQVWTSDGKVEALVVLMVTAGVDVAVFVPLAKLLRITEVTSVFSLVTARLRG